jgi:hypothetical protein
MDVRYGTELQFTPQGLAKRKRDDVQLATVEGEWQELERVAGQLAPADLIARQQRRRERAVDGPGRKHAGGPARTGIAGGWSRPGHKETLKIGPRTSDKGMGTICRS